MEIFCYYINIKLYLLLLLLLLLYNIFANNLERQNKLKRGYPSN